MQRADISKTFRCTSCNRVFKRQKAFEAHVGVCIEERAKKEWALRRAYPIYERWFRSNGRHNPTFETFSTSRFGSHFITFIRWCDTMQVSSTDVYTEIMLRHKLAPQLWSSTDSYRKYINEFDQTATVDQWLLATVSTISSVCASHNAPTSNFYRLITPTHLVHLLRTKSIYPRYLICDPEFTKYITRLPERIQAMIAEQIASHHLEEREECDQVVMNVIAHVNEQGSVV